jgi:hypothetical protein
MSGLKYFEKLDKIDSLLQLTSELGYREVFRLASFYLGDPHICRYFFEVIIDEEWVDVVTDSEFFIEYRSGSLPSIGKYQIDWYYLGFLLKVCDKKPSQVSNYLETIASLDDERLRSRIIEVMLLLPCGIAAKLIGNEVKWCRKKDSLFSLYPEYAGKLVLHVQNCDEEGSFELMKELLVVNSIVKDVGDFAGTSFGRTVVSKAKFSDWEYQALLTKYLSRFVSRCKNYRPVLEHMCAVLSEILAFDIGKSDFENDYSWVWRNTLEDNEQTRYVSGVKEYILVSLRDIVIGLIKEEKSRFREILSILSELKFTIFQRLSIYLFVKFPDLDIAMTQNFIMNTDLYDNYRTRNEYSLLLDSAFGIVNDVSRQVVFDWIARGPDITQLKASELERNGEMPSEEEVQERIEYWQKNRLHLIRKFLSGDWLEKYNSLVAASGTPEHPEYSTYTTSWIGPESPRTLQELGDMSVEEIVGYFGRWKSSGKLSEASPEGLSRIFTETVIADIEKYKHSASLFKELPPTYVRGMLQGLRDGVKSLDAESWSGIVDLSNWVLSQVNVVELESDDDLEEDSGWSLCRKTIASLLREGFKKSENQIPLELRESVWEIVLILSHDSDPTPSHEAKYGGSNMGPATLAINTVRGEAMHAMFEYGLWVARNTTDRKISLEDIPEMKEELVAHLDPEKDPSLAIRSVYGQYFPWLNLLDTNWSREARLKIFSNDQYGLGDAAWDSYITFCKAYDDTFRIIRDVYVKYAAKLSESKVNGDRERTTENLAAHLITFYWRSKLELADDCFVTFYQYAPLRLRKYAIEFIGRSLRNNNGRIEKNIESRLRVFYEWRQESSHKTSEYEELEGFCWWVDADVLDRNWVLMKFHELLQFQCKLDSLDFAARKLGSYLNSDPSKVLDCLSLMADRLNTEGVYFSWDEEAQQILREALLIPQVKDNAVDLVHKFGSKGLLKYRVLLHEHD